MLNKESYLKKLFLKYPENKERYNYNKFIYVNAITNVEIGCKKCNYYFKQTPSSHLGGVGCSKCSGKYRPNTEEWLLNLYEKLPNNINLYDYSKVIYVNANTKIEIICKTCNETFKQIPNSHLASGSGCSKCIGGCKYNMEEWLTIIHEKFPENVKLYDYNKVIYVNSIVKVIIGCKICGYEFNQSPNKHLIGRGCSKCNKKYRPTTEEWKFKIYERHRENVNLYDYIKVEYVNAYTKVEIICKTCNETFKQIPNKHLAGQGCPFCISSKGEAKTRYILTKKNIIFEEQKRFEDCRSKRQLPFDFCIENLNALIEFDGIQHFNNNTTNKHFDKDFDDRKERDLIKSNYAISNQYNFLRIAYTNIDNIESILEKFIYEINNISDKQVIMYSDSHLYKIKIDF